LGMAGAIFSAVMFLLMFVSAAFLQENYDALIGIITLGVFLTVYYYGFALKQQTLCKEEDKVFLLLHVKNFNRNKKKNNRFKGNRANIPTYRSHQSAENSSHGTSKVSPDVSYSADAPSGLWAQVRKFNLFKNNLVAPSGSTGCSSNTTSVLSREDAVVPSVEELAATHLLSLPDAQLLQQLVVEVETRMPESDVELTDTRVAESVN